MWKGAGYGSWGGNGWGDSSLGWALGVLMGAGGGGYGKSGGKGWGKGAGKGSGKGEGKTGGSGVSNERKLFVGGLPRDPSEESVRTFFQQFGEIEEVKMIIGEKGTSKGYCFVTFTDAEAAKLALANGENNEIDGQKVTVSASNGETPWRKPGDWTCPMCGDLNFERNSSCRSCGYSGGSSWWGGGGGWGKGKGKGGSWSGGGGGGNTEVRPGDWVCDQCGNNNFAYRDVCKQCGAAKPGGGKGWGPY